MLYLRQDTTEISKVLRHPYVRGEHAKPTEKNHTIWEFAYPRLYTGTVACAQTDMTRKWQASGLSISDALSALRVGFENTGFFDLCSFLTLQICTVIIPKVLRTFSRPIRPTERPRDLFQV